MSISLKGDNWYTVNTRIEGITLTDSQQSALERIVSFIEREGSRVFILKGYAGTGKTTMVKALINEIIKRDYQYVLLASTGRAAKVLSDATRITIKNENGEDHIVGTSAKTIHSQIYTFSDINQDMDLFANLENNAESKTAKSVKLKFTLKRQDWEASDIIYIVDESSMISDAKDNSMSQAIYGTDGRLLNDLLTYDPIGKFIFIGDACQLPPINQRISPALSKDYFDQTFGIEAEDAELTEVVRQANGNDIVQSAAKIRELFASPPPETPARFPFRRYRNIHVIRNEMQMVEMYLNCIKDKDYSKATLITMSNKTITSISNIIRPSLGLNLKTISVGDLLLVTQNNMISGLMNGDLVKVVQIGRRERRAGLSFVFVEVESLASHTITSQLLIEDIVYSGTTNITQDQQTQLFIDYHERMKARGIRQSSKNYKDGMMNDSYLNALRCVFGYALTCHKSQGGEWDKVFLMIPRWLPYNDPQSYAYQWVYTAMTRAKKELYVLDDYWVG